MKKDWPSSRTDAEAERFVAAADLAEYDFSRMTLVWFELRRKDRAVSLRLSDALLPTVRRPAARWDIPYRRFMQQAIEQATLRAPRRSNLTAPADPFVERVWIRPYCPGRKES